jgi:hypothetical protein
MTCHDARELFSALVDDALSAAERVDVDAHLGGCAECRRELERFQGAVSLLHRVEPARAPAGFVDRVLIAARPAPWYRRLGRVVFLPWPVKLPLEAAALVLVGGTVALLFRATPELQQAVRLETRPPAVSEAPPHPLPEPKPAAPAPLPEKKIVADKREERSTFRGETDTARRQDTAKAAPAPAAPGPTAPGEKTAAEAPGGIVAGRARPSVKEGAGSDVTAQRLSAARVAPAAADIAGRLAVADREAALRALADLVAKAGGRELARRAEPDGLVIELAVPRASWAEFARELGRLGHFTPEDQPSELPADVRLVLRITD